jgi:hypothetical protein
MPSILKPLQHFIKFLVVIFITPIVGGWHFFLILSALFNYDVIFNGKMYFKNNCIFL